MKSRAQEKGNPSSVHSRVWMTEECDTMTASPRESEAARATAAENRRLAGPNSSPPGGGRARSRPRRS